MYKIILTKKPNPTPKGMALYTDYSVLYEEIR